MTAEEALREATSGAAPRFSHRLAVAYRFLDVFTGATVAETLHVAIPQRNWNAYRSPRDHTYRFQVSNQEEIPGGTFDVEAEAPGGEYRAVEAVQVTLPLPPIAHPPPVVRADYLREAPLWPTRLKTLPMAETAVIGRVVSSGGATDVEGLRVFLFEGLGPPPALPYGSTDASGDFLYRLPGLRGSVSGSTVVSSATLTVQVFDGVTSVAVSPNTITVPLGQVSTEEFTVA